MESAWKIAIKFIVSAIKQSNLNGTIVILLPVNVVAVYVIIFLSG